MCRRFAILGAGLATVVLLASPAPSPAQRIGVSFGDGRGGISFGSGGTGFYYGNSPYSGYRYDRYGYPGYGGYYGNYSGYGYGSTYYNPGYSGYRNWGSYPGYYGYSSDYRSPAYSSGSYNFPAGTYYQSAYPSNYATPMAASSADQANSTAATVRVQVPANAQVWFGDHQTQQTGPNRLFVSPPLQANRDYSYTLRARWMDNGREVDRTRTVKVQPGATVDVNFLQGNDTETNDAVPPAPRPAQDPAPPAKTRPQPE
jgi:uncharacterized protein (TIGR03000 family)